MFQDRFEEAPTIDLLEPADGTYTNQSEVTFAGSLGGPADLEIDGIAVELDEGLNFHTRIELPEGASVIELRAQASGGAVRRKMITVTVDMTPPPAANIALISISLPVNGHVSIHGAPESAAEGTMVRIVNLRTGETVWAEVAEDGSFLAAMEGLLGDEYEITVYDLAENESEAVLIGGMESSPPWPAPGVINPIIGLEDWLYKGPGPIQIVEDPEIFEPERFAVIRGMVRDRSGEPLPDVTIRILGHPEFGYTHTQENGEFDLAVNGGGFLTVDFELSGFLPLQRRVRVPWQDYVYAEEVMMIPLDAKVTVIDLSDENAGMQVARGSVEEDLDGPRQATVLFPAGLAATIVDTSGEELLLDQISVRATEYTVGAEGPLMMPGELPPSIAYTYAVELSVDEALAAGATRVSFDQKVPFYVENFLDFPTGTGVPVGYYDRDLGAWVGYENGAVIEVIDIIDGLAILDVRGTGPASTEDLEALGISDAERSRLAELYDIGQTLQRVALDHFSPWDLNFPIHRDDQEDPPGPEVDPGPTRLTTSRLNAMAAL